MRQVKVAFWALMVWVGLSPLHLWVSTKVMPPSPWRFGRPTGVSIDQAIALRELAWAPSLWGALAFGALLVWNARWLLRYGGALPGELARRRRTLARMAWALVGATFLAALLMPVWLESKPGLVDLAGWTVLETVWGFCLLGASVAVVLRGPGAYVWSISLMKWSILVAAGAWAALLVFNIFLWAAVVLFVPVRQIPAVDALITALTLPVDPVVARLYFLTAYAAAVTLWIVAYGVRPAPPAPAAGPIPLPGPGAPGPVLLPPPPAASAPAPPPELPRDPATGRVRRRFG